MMDETQNLFLVNINKISKPISKRKLKDIERISELTRSKKKGRQNNRNQENIENNKNVYYKPVFHKIGKTKRLMHKMNNCFIYR